LVTLVGAQPGEDGVLGLALCLGGAFQMPPACGREGDDVSAPVAGVTVAGEEAIRFKRVEERHEDAWVRRHRLAELALAHRPVVVEQPEQLELTRHEVVGGVGVAQTAHRVVAKKRQKKPGARPALLEDALGTGDRFKSHVDNIASLIVETAILFRRIDKEVPSPMSAPTPSSKPSLPPPTEASNPRTHPK